MASFVTLLSTWPRTFIKKPPPLSFIPSSGAEVKHQKFLLSKFHLLFTQKVGIDKNFDEESPRIILLISLCLQECQASSAEYQDLWLFTEHQFHSFLCWNVLSNKSFTHNTAGRLSAYINVECRHQAIISRAYYLLCVKELQTFSSTQKFKITIAFC